MKITAISSGRPNQNSDKMARLALMSAQKFGAEVQLINLMKLDIKPCINCGKCVRKMRDVNFQGHCPLEKDDMLWLDDQILSSDGLIFIAPMFEAMVPGIYRIICDRIGPSHDVTFLKQAYDDRILKGIDPKIDTRFFDHKAVAFIGHGGSEWSYMGYPTLASPAISMGMDIVDYVQIEWNNDWVVNEEKKERVRQLGRNIAEAAMLPSEQRVYKGTEGACPACHCNVFRLDTVGDTATCALCGIVGVPVLRDGKWSLKVTAEEMAHSHIYDSGRKKHMEDLKHNAIVRAGIDQEAVNREFEPLKEEIPLLYPKK